jgi:3-oxoadipate enol-lactonase
VPPGPYTLADLGGDVIALLDRLGHARVHYVGLSLGGMVGMWLGRYAADRIASLTLCCTSAQLGPPETWVARAEQVRTEGVKEAACQAVGRWLTPEYAAANPDRVDWLLSIVEATPVDGYVASCAVIERMNLLPELPSISARTLVIAGKQDPSTPPEHGRRIVDGIPGARLELLNPAAHLANVEQPDLVSQLIIDQLGA